VNRVVFDSKGTLDQTNVGSSGEALNAMNLLNNCADASFATMATCRLFVNKPEFMTSTVEKHKAYLALLCGNLDHIKSGFKAGKSRMQMLTEFKQFHNTGPALP
jgi:hypothetical protein